MTTDIKKPSSPISQTTRNMIIGIITTVLVSGTVYLLGFNNKKSRATRLERQTATIEAWKSYVRIENNYAKNSALLFRDAAQFTSYKELYVELMKESDKFIAGLQGLIIIENLDKDMVAVLKRRAENEVSTKPRVEKFYSDFDKIVDIAVDSGWSEQRAQDTLVARSKVFEQQNKGMLDRALTEIESLSSNLAKKYDQPFNLDDFFIIQVYKHKKDMFSLLAAEKKDSTLPENVTKDYLTGKWDAAGATITLKADDTWTWYVPADSAEAKGDWELKGGQLVFKVAYHPKLSGTGSWEFNVSGVTDTSFSMMLSREPFNSYILIRK